MKILIIVPPYRTTFTMTSQYYPMPYGPVLVATTLQKQGHEVLVKDFLCPADKAPATPPASFAGKYAPPYKHYGQSIEKCLNWIAHKAPEYDAVGLATCQCNVWETAQIIAKEVKRLGLPLVAGGPYVTTAPDEAFAKFDMDVAVTYEGEGMAERAFEAAVAGETRVVFDGRNCMGFDETPVPNWDLLDTPLSEYPRFNGRMRGVLSISRGCPWQCVFCPVHTVFGRNHQRQGPERIKVELLNLYRRGVTYICFLDDNLFVNEKAANTLLDVVADLDVTEPGFKRVRFYVEEGIEVRMAAKPGFLQKLAGGRWGDLFLGLETVDPATAKAIKKPYKPEHVQAAFTNCKATGMLPRVFYIIGFQTDTLESVARDIVKLAGYGAVALPNNLKLYPNTGSMEEFTQAGRMREGYDWRLSAYHTPEGGALNFATIRKLKAIMRATGMAQEDFGVNPFTDDLELIRERMATKRYSIEYGTKGVVLRGNIYRNTPYRLLSEILCARYTGATGARAKAQESTIITKPTAMAKDEVQAALFAAMRGQTKPKTGLLF